MSIYIDGMDMPEEGGKIIIAADGSIWVNAWPTRGYMRVENAKAVPVPPHGRLIDADALAAVAGKRMGIINIGHIDDAPTVIEADGEE